MISHGPDSFSLVRQQSNFCKKGLSLSDGKRAGVSEAGLLLFEVRLILEEISPVSIFILRSLGMRNWTVNAKT